MVKFNSDNIVVGEIKQLLKSFNLPKATVLTGKETSYIPNRIYIKETKLFRSSLDGSSISEIEGSSYNWGDEIPNITTNLVVNSNIYDAYTHKYLGNYLRFLRDFKHIDLMSMYNCFSNESPAKFNYSFSLYNSSKHFNVNDTNFKIYMVPIKVGQVYTLSLNISKPFEIICGYYSHNEIIEMCHDTYTTINSCISSEVIVYDKVKSMLNPKYSFDNDFYMFIKLPISYNSSIVVLEGDYSNSNNVFINSSGYTEIKYTPSVVDRNNTLHLNKTASRLQLLSCLGSQSYPFADKLIQYLFSNIISSEDEVLNNIKRLQNKLYKAGYLDSIKRYGIWSDELTAACLLCNHDNLKHREIYKDYDVIGFLDSDVENELGGIY